MSADLDALMIDSPDLRWLAARDYMAEAEQAVTRQVNALGLIWEFLDLAERNALRRGVPYVPSWGVHLSEIDYLTARAVVLGRYKGLARERAREILDDYVPPMLRKGAK